MSVSLHYLVLAASVIASLVTCFQVPGLPKPVDMNAFADESLHRAKNIEQEADKIRQAGCALGSTDLHCNHFSLYRSFDGSCNNLIYPTHGQALRPHARLLQAEYSRNDGMRYQSKSNSHLPSTRKVSTTVLSAAKSSDRSHKITNMLWLWGQFLDHDFALTPQNPQVDCCGNSKSSTCIPIEIPRDDPFWAPHRRTCMNLVRSTGMQKGSCGLRKREQINAITSFIDASNVYGSSKEKADSLRTFSGGRMKTSRGDHLPPDQHGGECLLPPTERQRHCFLAGDERSTEWAGLTAVHTLFVRLHNKIADVFYKKLDGKRLSAKTRDTIAFQEARRVVAALTQVVTYQEFLPLVLGHSQMTNYALTTPSRGYRYSSRINPTIANVFATAAYRFGHSLITDGISSFNVNYQPTSAKVKLTDMFFQPTTYYRLGQNNLLRGLCSEAGNTMNDKFSEEIMHKLFEKNLGGLGMDLPAVNTQRGRDHGLPPYNKWRKHCGLRPITSFNQMPDHTRDVAAKFSQAYEHPDDIDVFFGGVTENCSSLSPAHVRCATTANYLLKLTPDGNSRPVDGGLVGPTFACILGDQFRKLKYGDRYWFENTKSVYKFSTRQIDQLKQMTLAKIICMTSDSMITPKNVFDMESPKVSCNRLPGLDLESWLDVNFSDLYRMTRVNPELFNTDDKLNPATNIPLFLFGRIPLKHRRH